jgi:hypothetical protein
MHDIQARRAIALQWFFPKENVIIARKARHEMLGPLKNKVPAQVRKTDQLRFDVQWRAAYANRLWRLNWIGHSEDFGITKH